MFKSIPANAIVAVAAAALAATLTIFDATGAIPEANAHAQNLMLPVQARDLVVDPAAADRLPEIAGGAKGSACSLRGWPRYEQSCLFDLRTPAKEVRTVRFIGLR
jgi:hypothetical protein